MQQFTSVKQVLAEFANRRAQRKLEREAAQIDRERPQQEKWCYTCRTTINANSVQLCRTRFHHLDGETMLNAHQCRNNDATNCGKRGTHMGQLTS